MCYRRCFLKNIGYIMQTSKFRLTLFLKPTKIVAVTLIFCDMIP